MFNSFGFLFSLLKGVYNTCAIHTQVKKQASVARILFKGLFGIFSDSTNKILPDAQMSEYKKNISTTPNTQHTSQDNRNTTSTARRLQKPITIFSSTKLKAYSNNRANLFES